MLAGAVGSVAMNGALKLNKKGLVEDPKYPCYKGEGYCRLRTMDTDKFECLFKPEICYFRKDPGG